MSTHRHFDKICCVVLCITLLITVVFMNSEKLGVQKASYEAQYQSLLFDNSKVHTIDIVSDDWEEFIQNCKSEEYSMCSVVIDNEVFKNVGIRGKGNTSLTQVESYGNGRYSFKLEFDRYDSTNTYYGLDKLCLNNIIQDNTYMKDYIAYTLMYEFGVASPLCSFVYITVNGEDWGLYLAVEGVEEAFLQRNYGSDYGELYKPDSLDMGGGRGNGGDFDISDFMENFDFSDIDLSEIMTSTVPNEEEPSQTENTEQTDNFNPDNNNNGNAFEKKEPFGNMPDGEMPSGMTEKPDNMPQSPDGVAGMPEMPNGFSDGESVSSNTQTPPKMPSNMEMPSDTDMPDGIPQIPSDFSGDEQKDFSQSMTPGEMPGMSSQLGSSDVLLQYTDDEFDSYSNIFDNAKTDITSADKTRLINSLKNLSENNNLSETVDIEKVIKYFVVHNFVLNFDSYTGSMIHNYYLYEKDGILQMIPWDYNLSFGGFQSAGGAESLVNYPIDSPTSGGSVEDRPMLSWIFENEEYTELYHEYFSQFISQYFDSGYFENMIDETVELISEYVEKDPTKFCTYEEFLTGAETLKSFCTLRAQSISLQLDGAIGSTSDTQQTDTLVAADGIEISAMGSMNNSMGFGSDKFTGDMENGGFDSSDVTRPEIPNTNGDMNAPEIPDKNGDMSMPDGTEIPDKQNSGNDEANTDTDESQSDFDKDFGNGKFDGSESRPDKDFSSDKNFSPMSQQTGDNGNALVLLILSVAVLLFGLAFAFLFMRKRK